MPSKSKSQQRFFGMVDAYKKGEMKNASSKIKKAANGMSMSDVKDFAETKHKGLPEKVEEHLHRIVRESVNKILNENNPYNINDMKQFVSDLSNMAKGLYRYACDFEGIDQETRQRLISVGKEISSIRQSMFSDSYPIPNGKLSPFDDDEREFTSSRFDDDY